MGWWFLILVMAVRRTFHLFAWVGWDTGRLVVCSKKHGIDSTEPRGNDFWFSSAESPDRDWHISDFFRLFLLLFLLFSIYSAFFLLFLWTKTGSSPFRPRREYNRRTRTIFFICYSNFWLALQRKSKSKAAGWTVFHTEPNSTVSRQTAHSFKPKIFICHRIFRLLSIPRGRVSERGGRAAFPL